LIGEESSLKPFLYTKHLTTKTASLAEEFHYLERNENCTSAPVNEQTAAILDLVIINILFKSHGTETHALQTQTGRIDTKINL
jgi:hypothetical protein